MTSGLQFFSIVSRKPIISAMKIGGIIIGDRNYSRTLSILPRPVPRDGFNCSLSCEADDFARSSFGFCHKLLRTRERRALQGERHVASAVEEAGSEQRDIRRLRRHGSPTCRVGSAVLTLVQSKTCPVPSPPSSIPITSSLNCSLSLNDTIFVILFKSVPVALTHWGLSPNSCS